MLAVWLLRKWVSLKMTQRQGSFLIGSNGRQITQLTLKTEFLWVWFWCQLKQKQNFRVAVLSIAERRVFGHMSIPWRDVIGAQFEFDKNWLQARDWTQFSRRMSKTNPKHMWLWSWASDALINDWRIQHHLELSSKTISYLHNFEQLLQFTANKMMFNKRLRRMFFISIGRHCNRTTFLLFVWGLFKHWGWNHQPE